MKVLIILAAALSVASAGIISTEFESVLPVENALYPDNEIKGRITNGHSAVADQFPYQVGLALKKGLFSSSWCGGSLISNEWVLTAAHCTDGVKSVTVYLGSTVRTSPKVAFKLDKSAIFQHAGFDTVSLANDISLIKIPAVTYSSSIQPIRLATVTSRSYAGFYAIASGWGRTSDTSSVADSLNYARLEVITNSVCKRTYGRRLITSNTICVSTPAGASTCQGDSGGPLVSETEHVLIGIASFVSARGCAAGYPSGFTRVTSFLDWIQSQTGIPY